MRKLSDEQWKSLASGLSREMTRVAPDWTDYNTHDPGITLLELFAYALTDMQYRMPLNPNGRALARRVAQLAESLTAETAMANCPPGLQRPRFAPGLLLTDDDLNAAVTYTRDSLHRHNRMLHGWGIVSGLGVTLEPTGSGAQLVIAPGFAINRCGQEIDVCAPATLPLPAKGTALLVLLHYAEQPCRPVNVPAADADAESVFSRIAETFSATLAPASDDNAVAVARVTFSQGRWLLDHEFSAVRVHA